MLKQNKSKTKKKTSPHALTFVCLKFYRHVFVSLSLFGPVFFVVALVFFFTINLKVNRNSASFNIDSNNFMAQIQQNKVFEKTVKLVFEHKTKNLKLLL
jgi:hypothetical protein